MRNAFATLTSVLTEGSRLPRSKDRLRAAYLDRSYLAGLRNPSVRSLLKIANALKVQVTLQEQLGIDTKRAIILLLSKVDELHHHARRRPRYSLCVRMRHIGT